MPMETGRNLEHTTERYQRGFKVPMEMGSLTYVCLLVEREGDSSFGTVFELRRVVARCEPTREAERQPQGTHSLLSYASGPVMN